MCATPKETTLLEAARNFIRTSRGTTLLIIAPLAALGLATNVRAQTTFSQALTPALFAGGTASVEPTPSGDFSMSGGILGGIQSQRFGSSADVTTAHVSGGNTVALNFLFINYVNTQNIPAATVIPLAYDFTLTRAGNVAPITWRLEAAIWDGSMAVIGNGTFASGTSQTFTGSANYLTGLAVNANAGHPFQFNLFVDYVTAAGDSLGIVMNPATQGITINAIPEPGTYAALFGTAALGFVRRRRAARA